MLDAIDEEIPKENDEVVESRKRDGSPIEIVTKKAKVEEESSGEEEQSSQDMTSNDGSADARDHPDVIELDSSPINNLDSGNEEANENEKSPSKRRSAKIVTTPKSQKKSKEEREAEKAARQAEREAAVELKKKQLEEKRLEKEKLQREKEQKRKEQEEKRAKAKQEEEERKERKRKELEEKAERKRLEEEEKRQKEEMRLKKKQEEEEAKEQKRKEKEAKEEQKRKEREAKEEQEKKEKEIAEEKKKRESNRFLSFFKKEDKPTAVVEKVEKEVNKWFRPFEIKEGMKLAPVHYRETLSSDVDILQFIETANYLETIRGRKRPRIVLPELRCKLLQFHDNYRPPYFGTWRQRSTAITGRRFLGKEETLNYEVDSDLEWEEEPSDAEECRSDDEEEKEEEEEEDNEGFLVEHGYLSDGEGESQLSDPNDEQPAKTDQNPDHNRAPDGKDIGRDTEELRRARLASRARDYNAGVARKKQKLVPVFWLHQCVSGTGGVASSSIEGLRVVAL